MDSQTLIAMIDFTRGRLLGTLDAIEKSGQDPAKVLAWRPGPGRAHIAWQAVHCAATHDKYFHVIIKGDANPTDPKLVEQYGGGSTPDQNVPTLAEIRAALARHLEPLKAFVRQATPDDLARIVGPPNRRMSAGEGVILLAWHEAHHQGQMHLTWNLYQAAHGLK